MPNGDTDEKNIKTATLLQQDKKLVAARHRSIVAT